MAVAVRLRRNFFPLGGRSFARNGNGAMQKSAQWTDGCRKHNLCSNLYQKYYAMEASYSEVGVLIELSFGKKFEIVGKWAGLNAKQKEIRKYHTPSKPRLPRHLLPLLPLFLLSRRTLQT